MVISIYKLNFTELNGFTLSSYCLTLTLNSAPCEELLIKFDEGAPKEKALDYLCL